jgi:hypothetical protein
MDHLIDSLPFWLLFICTFGFVLLAVMAGFWLGRRDGSRSASEPEAPVGSMVGATMGLLAFMLAFTFGMAASRHDTRRHLVLDEANAIGTAYLRTQLLPQPQAAEMQNVLREYVDMRLLAVRQPVQLASAIARSEELHTLLWAQTLPWESSIPTRFL